MNRRWLLVSFTAAAALLACTDRIIAPDSAAGGPRPLPLPEYALQLRGDPFLRSISGMLGRPQLADAIDAAVGGLDQVGSTSSDATRFSIASARLTLESAQAEDTVVVITERDVLQAVVEATLDRIAQVNADSTAAPASSDPPPSR